MRKIEPGVMIGAVAGAIILLLAGYGIRELIQMNERDSARVYVATCPITSQEVEYYQFPPRKLHGYEQNILNKDLEYLKEHCQ